MATAWKDGVEQSNVKERSRVAKNHPGKMSPIPKAGPGWRGALRKAPADPDDVKRPTASDIVKT
jgi:hypothetical protein